MTSRSVFVASVGIRFGKRADYGQMKIHDHKDVRDSHRVFQIKKNDSLKSSAGKYVRTSLNKTKSVLAFRATICQMDLASVLTESFLYRTGCSRKNNTSTYRCRWETQKIGASPASAGPGLKRCGRLTIRN